MFAAALVGTAMAATLAGQSRFVLLSHGSRRPDSWAQLRALAAELAAAHPAEVTAAHVFFGSADAADAERGADAPPPSLALALRALIEADPARPVVVLPFILGPSRALRAETPRVIREVRASLVPRDGAVTVLPCLADALDGAGCEAISAGLAAQVERTIAAAGLVRPTVYICDHGSADPAVAGVRRRMVARIGWLLDGRVAAVLAAPMERPERLGVGSAADDPLLEERLAALGPDDAEAVVAMAFLSPGTHAGDAGDVAQIVARATAARPRLRVHATALLGDAAAVRDALSAALRAALVTA
jgi:hypothetical protein